MRKSIDFDLSAPACFLAAAALFILPLRWLAAALIAASFHEFCHFTALRRCGVRILHLRIGITGTVMETEPMEVRQELLCALAGPLGSLVLTGAGRLFPILAICGLVQGLYNLLPLYPLDGGRIVRSMLCIFFPGKQDRVMRMIQSAALFILTLLSFYCLKYGIGVSLALFFPAAKALARKIPCKEGRSGVQ